MELFSEPNAICFWKRDGGAEAWEVGLMCNVVMVHTVVLLAQVPGVIHFCKQKPQISNN